MSDLSTQLPQRLTRPEENGLDAGLLIPLLRLLGDGDPVTVEQLPAAASRPERTAKVNDYSRGAPGRREFAARAVSARRQDWPEPE